MSLRVPDLLSDDEIDSSSASEDSFSESGSSDDNDWPVGLRDVAGVRPTTKDYDQVFPCSRAPGHGHVIQVLFCIYNVECKITSNMVYHQCNNSMREPTIQISTFEKLKCCLTSERTVQSFV